MKVSRTLALLSSLVVAYALPAQPVPRRPRGIYAKVNIAADITQQQKANPSITPAGLNAYFIGLYQALLANPAISGLALQVHWDQVNPNAPPAANAYDWTYLDDAFDQVATWNAQHPGQLPKSIQLIMTPGFQTPQWAMDQIPSCDGLFQSPSKPPATTCGKATFKGFTESADGTELPLPWNAFYKNAWKIFLTALAARYGSRSTFVSIAVGGPTAASEEMILPNDNNTPAQFGGIKPNDMWLKLLALQYPDRPAYDKSDQAFIDEWNAAIDLYGSIFSGVTLIATTGSGLPNLANAGFASPPPALSADCGRLDMDCAAETMILSHFSDSSVGGANAKATQTSGMEASRVNDQNLGVNGVKLLSKGTAQLTAPAAQVLGGAQFNTSFSTGAYSTIKEGCTSRFPPGPNDTPAGCYIVCTNQSCPVPCIPQACLAPGVTQASLSSYILLSDLPGTDLISPEQAVYNVLTVFFDGTPAASSFGATEGTVPLNYLQIYATDIQYATANANAPVTVVRPNGTTFSTTAQAILNLASQKLLQIGEPALLPTITSGGIIPGTIQPGEWVTIYGANLASGTATWKGDFPSSLGGTSVTINGRAAYLSYVSPGQIDVQAPDDTATGTVSVVVTTVTGSAMSTVTLAQASPSFFLLDNKHVAGIILRPSGGGAFGGGSYDIVGPTGTSLGYPTVAAKAGDTVLLFGSGFGPTDPVVGAGQSFSGAAPTTNPVTLRINGVSITPSFAGLSGAGVYQLNLTVPSGLGSGDVQLQATVGGVQAPSGVVISLQ